MIRLFVFVKRKKLSLYYYSLLRQFRVFLVLATFLSESLAVQIYRPGPWSLAHATFYGDETASATMGMSAISMHLIFIFKLLLLGMLGIMKYII